MRVSFPAHDLKGSNTVHNIAHEEQPRWADAVSESYVVLARSVEEAIKSRSKQCPHGDFLLELEKSSSLTLGELGISTTAPATVPMLEQ
jgi:hypothetical protein